MRERLPFLFIQCRPDGDIARDEKETIAQVTGLTVGDSLRTHLYLPSRILTLFTTWILKTTIQG